MIYWFPVVTLVSQIADFSTFFELALLYWKVYFGVSVYEYVQRKVVKIVKEEILES